MILDTARPLRAPARTTASPSPPPTSPSSPTSSPPPSPSGAPPATPATTPRAAGPAWSAGTTAKQAPAAPANPSTAGKAARLPHPAHRLRRALRHHRRRRLLAEPTSPAASRPLHLLARRSRQPARPHRLQPAPLRPDDPRRTDHQRRHLADRPQLRHRRRRRRPDQRRRPRPVPDQESRRHPAPGLHHQPLGRRRPEGLQRSRIRSRDRRSPAPAAPQNRRSATSKSKAPWSKQKVLGSPLRRPQGENPNRADPGNLLTLYLVARNPELGVLIKQALKVAPDPVTGQLTTEVDNVPQLPFSHFHLSFRQGQRSTAGHPAGLRHLHRQGRALPLVEPGRPGRTRKLLPDHPGPRRPGLPLRRRPALPPGPRSRHPQQRRRHLLAPSTPTSRARTPNRRSPTSRSSCRRA